MKAALARKQSRACVGYAFIMLRNMVPVQVALTRADQERCADECVPCVDQCGYCATLAGKTDACAVQQIGYWLGGGDASCRRRGRDGSSVHVAQRSHLHAKSGLIRASVRGVPQAHRMTNEMGARIRRCSAVSSCRVVCKVGSDGAAILLLCERYGIFLCTQSGCWRTCRR